jgi:F-type H+-transporting ATPase subunit alpha
MKKVAGRLRLDLAQYREIAAFAQFGSELDEATQSQLNRGQRLTEILKQDQYSPIPVERQVASVYLGVNGHLDEIPVERCQEFVSGFLKYLEGRSAETLNNIRSEKEISEATEEALKKAIGEFKADWSRETEAA